MKKEIQESKEVQKKLLDAAQSDIKKMKEGKLEVIVKNQTGAVVEVKKSGAAPIAKVQPNTGLVMDTTQ